MRNKDKIQEISLSPEDRDSASWAPPIRMDSGFLTARLSLVQPYGNQAIELPPDLEILFRQLISAVPPPVGMPRLGHVLEAMACAVGEFVNGLIQPRPEIVIQADKFDQLAQLACNTANPALDYPIPMRRMRSHQGWLYFMQVHTGTEEGLKRKVAGAALVMAIAKSNGMSNELASLLVASAKGALVAEQEQVLARRSAKLMAEASRQFEIDPNGVPVVVETFEERIRSRFRSTLFNARDREHQAIADHRASSRAQMLDSARQLREKTETGDSLTLFLVISVLANLPESIANGLPLLHHAASDWLMVLDADAGCLKVSIDLYAPDRANYKVPVGHAVLDAGDIVVIPLPEFAASALNAFARKFPESKTLGDLLGQDVPQKLRFLKTRPSGIAATVARFRNGLGPLAVEAGLSRYEASMLLTNPLLTPTGKFYYACVAREALWDAATTLYDTLGWGVPVGFQPGLATGSRQVVTDTTIQSWVKWLAEQLHACKPGRRYTLETIVAHHNVLALVCASLSTFLLALRARKVLPITQGMLDGGGLTVPIFDKRVGQFFGARPVPVCALQQTVFTAWLRHQQQFIKRLDKIDSAPCHKLCMKLHACLNLGEAAFFEIGQHVRVEPIGTERIHAWWPSHLRLARNFGRHFWQNRLRSAGVIDTEIDAFVRHSASGMDVASSVSHVVSSDWARRMISVINRVVDELGIDSIIDLPR